MKIGFIGCGNMGGALALAASKSKDAEIFLFDKDEAKAKLLSEKIGNATITDAKSIASECALIFLGVKPNVIPDAIFEINKELEKNENACLVSMAAGVSIADIERYLDSDGIPIIRIMPNTPAQIGSGMILYTKNKAVNDNMLCSFTSSMAAAGSLDMLPEKLIDAASALSGCGPAFAYMFIEALSDGAVSCGLPRDKALRYASETLIGAARMVLETGAHPGALKDAVCSPGGSTIEGVSTLEKAGFRAAAADAVVSAYQKTLKLGKKV